MKTNFQKNFHHFQTMYHDMHKAIIFFIDPLYTIFISSTTATSKTESKSNSFRSSCRAKHTRAWSHNGCSRASVGVELIYEMGASVVNKWTLIRRQPLKNVLKHLTLLRESLKRRVSSRHEGRVLKAHTSNPVDQQKVLLDHNIHCIYTPSRKVD